MIKHCKNSFIKGIRESLMEKFNKYQYVQKKGFNLLQDPNLNKCLAFSDYERRCLGLEGFIPDRQLNIQ